MCVMSAVMDQYNPYIPQPNAWPIITPQPNTKPYTVPSVEEQVREMAKLIESFRKATEAAQVFDEVTGQPDCIDPEKAKLLERVAEFEAKIRKIENPQLLRFHIEYDVDIDAYEFASDFGLEFNDSDSQKASVIAYVQKDAESTDGYLVDNYVATVVE